jgi:transcription elongation factor
LFKAENNLEEILINAQLKMQKAKNELIKNLEKDMEKVAELISIEEDLSVVKDEMDEVSTILDERIEIEKETLNIKAKE